MCALSFAIESLRQHFSNLWDSHTSTEYFDLVDVSDCLSGCFKNSFDWTIDSCEKVFGGFFNFGSLEGELEGDVIEKFRHLNTRSFISTKNLLDLNRILKQPLSRANISSDIRLSLSFFERVEPLSQDINNDDIEILHTKSFIA